MIEQQPELFPMARSGDPLTSHLGADSAIKKLSQRRTQVLNIVKADPGLTAGEYSPLFYRAYPGLGFRCAIDTPQKRLSELEKLGRVKHGRVRVCKETGRQCLTWWPA